MSDSGESLNQKEPVVQPGDGYRETFDSMTGNYIPVTAFGELFMAYDEARVQFFDRIVQLKQAKTAQESYRGQLEPLSKNLITKFGHLVAISEGQTIPESMYLTTTVLSAYERDQADPLFRITDKEYLPKFTDLDGISERLVKYQAMHGFLTIKREVIREFIEIMTSNLEPIFDKPV